MKGFRSVVSRGQAAPLEAMLVPDGTGQCRAAWKLFKQNRVVSGQARSAKTLDRLRETVEFPTGGRHGPKTRDLSDLARIRLRHFS